MNQARDDAPQPDDQHTLIEERSAAPGPVEEGTLGDSSPEQAARRAASGEAIPLSRLAEYELIVELGRGGMGVVYRARHVKLGRTVALKMILGGTLARAEDLQRFEMEAAAAAQLQHPSIVSVFEVGCEDNQPYFTMEYIRGTNLAARVAGSPLPGRKAAEYLEAAARAVHFAHEHDILHRDLKPANILLDEHDQPKITDFGLAKVLSTDSGQTRTGAVLGTPSYMSPEQAQGRKDIGPASDIYSLGAILYEMLTGRPPFRGETALATLSLVTHQEPVQPRLLNPSVDRDLETICLKCLEKDPDRRYASALDLADDLRRFQREEPISARRLGVVGRAIKWCRRKPTQAALLAVSLLAALGFMAFQFRTAMQERELRQEAEQANAKAQARERTMAYLLYHAQMRRAQQAIEHADWDRAEQLLAAWETARVGGTDLRDWEWFFLKERCGSRFSFRVDPGDATAVAYRPDGKQIASAGGEPKKPSQVKIWNAQSGALVATLPGHGNRITSLAYNGNLKTPATLLASAGYDRLVKVWNLETGTELAALTGHTAHVNGVAFSADGRWLASAGGEGDVRLWQVDAIRRGDLAPAVVLKAHDREVSAVAFAPHAPLLASAGFDGLVRLWHVHADGKAAKPVTPAQTLRGHRGEVSALAFSPDGDLLASGGGRRGARQGEVRIWDVATGEPSLTRFGFCDNVLALAFGRGGELAAAGSDGLIRLWTQALSSEALTLRGDTQLVYSLSFSPDGMRLASAGHSGRVSIHNTSGGLETLTLPLAGQLNALAFNPAGRFLAAAGNTSNISVWNLDYPGQPITLANTGDAILYALAFSPDGMMLASGGSDNLVRLHDLQNPDKVPTVLAGHDLPVMALAFRPDGQELASASDDGTIRIWNPRDGSLLRELKKTRETEPGHDNGVLAVVYSPDGRYLASAGHDKNIILWSLREKTAVVMTGHTRTVHGLAFSNDGSFLASVSGDRTLRVWDLKNDNRAQVFEGSPGPVLSVAYHPGGRRLATIGQDKTIRLWDVVARQEILELEDAAGSLREVAFSRDGRFLAVAGQNAVRVWDAGRRLPEGEPR